NVSVGRNPDVVRAGASRAELRGSLTTEQAKDHRRGKSAKKRPPPPMLTHVPWPKAERHGHYPSSWYKSTTKPVSPPASTGDHAAKAGCSSSALLKSSVTLERT